MKIQGRFIVILAVLGLLVALVPLASAGAVAGKVTLSGGEKGQFFSDQTRDNIITVKLVDSDLTPLRMGTARTSTGAGLTVDLSTYIVAGETEVTERFDGGLNNPLCDHDGDDPENDGFQSDGTTAASVRQHATDAIRTTLAAATASGNITEAGIAAAIAACADQGDGTVVPGPDNTLEPTAIAETEVADNAYRFDLDGVARDLQGNSVAGVGQITSKDIISVTVNGRTATRSKEDGSSPDGIGSAPWFQIVQQGGSNVGIDNAGTAVAGVGIGEAGGAEGGDGIVAVVIHGLKPQDAPNSVSVTFKDTEYEFNHSTTPVDIGATTVHFGGSVVNDSTGYTNARGNAGVTGSSATGSSVTVGVTLSGYTIVNFGYDVEDKFSADKSMVTLSSTSAGDIRLAIAETGPASDTFEAKVAVFSQEDRGEIATEAGRTTVVDGERKFVHDDGTSVMVDGVEVDEGIVNIDELVTALEDAGTRSLRQRLERAAEALGYDDATKKQNTSIDTLLGRIVQSRHDDIITVTYQDANPATSVSDSARVDLEAPEVMLISPAHNFFTNIGSVTMSAEVTDTGAGVDQGSIDLKINEGTTGISRGAAIETPIENGYRITASSEGTITEGPKKWFIGVMDKVGNVPDRDIVDSDKRADGQAGDCGGDNPACGTGPVGVNEAPRGAASNADSAADNPFVFTVDTRAPSLASGKTGRSLKNPGVTTGTNKETENDKNQNTWVRVVFSTGEGKAPLDPASVSAEDFRVDDATPLDYKINSVTHEDDTATIAKGTAVYLLVGTLDSDARPEVELAGEVKDKAGNTRSEGRLAAINDGLAPKLTVTPSADIAKDQVTVTVSSDENLRTNPAVELTETKPEKGEAIDSPKDLIVSLQTGSLTTWTGTFKNASGQASIRYVTVTASDSAGNEAKKGIAATETDLVKFQVDSAPPTLEFKSASGKDLDTSTAADKPQEGAVWIVMEFDEDEHAGDSYRKVEVTSLTLMNKDTEEVITEDVSQVFGSEVNCADHAHTGEGDAPTDKCARRTLAVDLMPGEYNIKVTGVDQTGNEVTKNTDFEVVEAKPFTLTLRPGQNFISIPGMPMGDGGNIDTLLADEAISSVSTYDRAMELAGENPWLRSTKDLETGMFSGDITAIEPGKAYFVNSTASVTVKVKLQAAGDLPPTIPVRQGYNAIGFWSVSGDASAEIDLYLGSIGWSVAYAYDPTPGVGWQVLRKGGFDAQDNPLKIEAGKGYLVYALYDAVLTP